MADYSTATMDGPAATIRFAVKRLDLNDEEISDVILLNLKRKETVSDVTQRIRSKLELIDSELIFKLRNARGRFVSLNGKMVEQPSTHTSPLTLEVVRRFQSVEPEPKSLRLVQFEDSMMKRLVDIQERIKLLEMAEKNMEKRRQKIKQEVATLESTVDFLIKRMQEAENVNWNGMFIRYPLW